ncbi:MAG: indole-3-glycerol phosphate synthase TrpC [Candidatus Obscuribacterales bacterium]|nr:indole-3-glycerol phosphate synthase TrpC [Candidatus Obscuribacterales bacterium]
MPESTVLAEIIAHKREEIEVRKTATSLAELENSIEPGTGDFLKSLTGGGLRLIAEIKPASPSAGVLKKEPDIKPILDAYNKYAAAISVLTDMRYFGGSLTLLKDVVHYTRLPVLCKDFIIDVFQIYEARLKGAEAILLIVKALEDNRLAALHSVALELGMTPVVEIQNEEELKRALDITPQVLLINNRNLDNLKIDLSTTERLAPLIPDYAIAVSASGIESRQDIDRLSPYCSRFLIGSALMKAKDLEAKLKELSGR